MGEQAEATATYPAPAKAVTPPNESAAAPQGASEGNVEQSVGSELIELLTAQLTLEVERLDRHLGRLATFQTAVPFTITVLGAAAAIGRYAAPTAPTPSTAPCPWILLVAALISLITSFAISLHAIDKSGVAGMSSEQLKKWFPDHWTTPSVELRRYRCESILNAIVAQEGVADRLRSAWRWAAGAHFLGSVLSVGGLLILLTS